MESERPHISLLQNRSSVNDQVPDQTFGSIQDRLIRSDRHIRIHIEKREISYISLATSINCQRSRLGSKSRSQLRIDPSDQINVSEHTNREARDHIPLVQHESVVNDQFQDHTVVPSSIDYTDQINTSEHKSGAIDHINLSRNIGKLSMIKFKIQVVVLFRIDSLDQINTS